MDERVREAHGEEVERHEGARGDREHRRVARLALAVLDRVAQRVIRRVEQEDDQEADQGRLVPDPPLAPLGLRPDRARDEDRDSEDDREVDGNVGACVVDRVAASQVADGVDSGDHEADQRADRQRHVQVEDLLDEALGVERRVEEDQREAGREDRDRCRCLGSQARDVHRSVLQQEVIDGVSDQEENHIVEGQDRQPFGDPVVRRPPCSEQRLRRAGGGDHHRHQQGQEHQRHQQIARARVRGDRRHHHTGGRQADVGEQQDARERRQPRPRVEEEDPEHGQGDRLQHQQVDDQRRRLGRSERRAVDGRQADRVEAALVALGDEQPVDGEDGREQDRRQQHPGGEAAAQLAAVEPEAEEDEGGDREEHHRGHRLEGAQLDPQVLGQDRLEGAKRAGSRAHGAPP